MHSLNAKFLDLGEQDYDHEKWQIIFIFYYTNMLLFYIFSEKKFYLNFLDSPGGKGDELKEGSYHSIRRYIPDGHEHHFESSGVYRMKLLCVHII